jgi:hypothetical protein
MGKQINKLVEKVISSLDWESILEVNKCFKLGVGEGTSIIPGIKRKVFSDSLSKNDLKSELRILLTYAIENDVAELFYGPWMIFWVNSEWVELKREEEEESSQESEVQSSVDLNLESSLEVIYSPQRIHVVGRKNTMSHDESDVTRLEAMLKKALDSENYEVASKIKELLSLQKGEPTEDK